MKVGLAYMVQTVDWFTWVSRVVRQIGPWEWEFTECSKVCETNAGDNWEQLASGDEKASAAAVYKHYRILDADPDSWVCIPVILGLGVVMKCEWCGPTPSEANLPG